MKKKSSIRRFWEILNADDETPESTKTKRRIILAAIVPANIVTIVISVINASTTTPDVMYSTMILSVGLFIVNIMTLKNAPLKYVAWCFCITICPIFSFYVIAGGANGFGIQWVLLIPLGVFMVFGLRAGLITSTWFLVLIYMCFYGPAKSLLLYEYSEEVLTRFPMLYTLSFVFSFIANFQIKSLQIRQLHHNAELRQSVLEERDRVEQISLETISIIMKALEAKDNYTKYHSLNVAKYAKAIAEKLKLPSKETEHIYTLGLLHDIGKIGVPEAILNKPDRLTDDEFEKIKAHVVVGCEILKNFSSMPELYIGALYHHERYDGKGYSNGLSGDDLPLAARIIAVADSVDAMHSNRIYRTSRSREYVIKQLEENKGTQFDPGLSDIMIQLIGEGILAATDEYFLHQN
ncbi:MAG: HD-GYP domain-containing protein [Spirochaetota bacterium]|nr:HD-GYP domain-containing protein [Spirochaetota bacterium]